MLCIGSGIITFFFLAAVVFTGTGGVIAYRFLISDGQTDNARFTFFCSLIAMLFLLFIFIIILVRAKKRTNELRHILNLAREGGRIDSERFKAFGSLGAELKALFAQTEELNAMRAQRIKYLNNAITTILSEADMPMLLLDAEGKVVHASPMYFDKYTDPGKSGETYGQNIEQLHTGISFITASKEAAKTHSDVLIKTETFTVKLQPIYTTLSEPEGYLAVFEKTGKAAISDTALNTAKKASANAAEARERTQKLGSKFTKTVKEWFGRRNDK